MMVDMIIRRKGGNYILIQSDWWQSQLDFPNRWYKSSLFLFLVSWRHCLIPVM